MNFQEWVEKYKPIKAKDGNVLAFETYGGYAKFISEKNNFNVWTLVEGEGELEIVAGKRFINRLNYFVTEIEWEHEFEFVTISDEDETSIFYSF